MEKQKKIALINDMSCIGRCSLTAALPIISSCGFESVPLPTGVFSAHTEFEGYVCADLTDKMGDIINHWKSLDVRFDCIYTGYLASIEQAESVRRFILDFKKSDTVCIVDPVMGDNGKFYSRIDGSFIEEMRFLCSVADVIVPNVTEAEMLAGVDCTTDGYDIQHIKDLIMKLRNVGAAKVVITGVDLGDGQIGCAAYDSITGRANMFFTPKVEGRFPGTGDVFASALTAAIMSGKDFIEAVQLAMGFTSESVEYTAKSESERKYGLCFESFISDYSRVVKKNGNA